MPYVKSAGERLHYEIIDLVAPWYGARETIVFHHGIGADPGIWSDWLPRLADRYRIVRFDMRGYGRSEVPPPDFEWTIDQFAADVLAVADAAGTQRFHLVGESIGGTIGLYCALRHPLRVATLTVSNGAHTGTSVQRVDAWRRQLDGEGIKAWSDQFMRDRFFDGALDAARYAWFARCQEAWPRDSTLNALSVLIGSDLTGELGNIHCPVLLMHPDSSPFIPVGVAAALHAGLPDSVLRVVPHSRHGLPFSHAHECAQALREFLDARGATRS